MLHNQLGDDLFWKSIRTYVKRFGGQPVETVDFINSIEQATGRNMRAFFDQWIYSAGHPTYRLRTWWDAKKKQVHVRVVQSNAQGGEKLLHDVSTVILVKTKKGEKRFPVRIHEKSHHFHFKVNQEPVMVLFDPDHRVLKKVDYPRAEASMIHQLEHDPNPCGRIEAAKTSKNEMVDKIRQMETILNRPLTQDELLKHLGIAPTENKTTNRDKKYGNLRDRGYSEDFANDMANGFVTVKGPDNEGRFFAINSVTNERRQVNDADARLITDETAAQPAPKEAVAPPPVEKAPGKVTALEEDISKGTGPIARIESGLSNVFGPFIKGAVFEETTNARKSVETFNLLVKQAFNPGGDGKFPVHEQKLIEKLLPEVDAFFRDPDRVRGELKEMEKSLVNLTKIRTDQLKSGSRMTEKRKGTLIDQISIINEVLSYMHIPSEREQGRIFVDPQTKVRVIFLGGDENDPKNYEELK